MRSVCAMIWRWAGTRVVVTRGCGGAGDVRQNGRCANRGAIGLRLPRARYQTRSGAEPNVIAV